MQRGRAAVSLSLVALLGCASREEAPPKDQTPAAGESQAAGQASAGQASGGSYAEAAAKVTDICPLAPAKMVQTLVPGANPPERERYPVRCTFRNAKSGLGLTIDNGPPDPINGAQAVPGLGDAAYLERLDPTSRGDVYLTVMLGQSANGTNYNMHVEVAGHDGKEHRDDAVAVAREVLAQLH